MTSATPRTNPPTLSGLPRQSLDPSIRRLTYGRIKPMDSDLTWWERLFRR